MVSHCNYSFSDLFKAAHERAAEPGELEALYVCSRDEINRIVQEWAERAGWETKPVRGSDGATYLAFWPGDTTASHPE